MSPTFVCCVCACVFACVCVFVCVCLCVCDFVCICVRAHACAWVRVRACVRAFCPVDLATASKTFGILSKGAVGDGPSVKHRSRTSDGGSPWALVSAPLAAVLSLDGDAFADFLVEEAGKDDYVSLLLAPDTMDPAQGARRLGQRAVHIWMEDGRRVNASVDGEGKDLETPHWCAGVKAGHTLRVRYVHGTRMVSVLFLGRTYAMCALPAAYDVARYHFGVDMGRRFSMRVTDASPAGARCCGALRCASPCKLQVGLWSVIRFVFGGVVCRAPRSISIIVILYFASEAKLPWCRFTCCAL